MQGWIKIDRKLMDNWIYSAEPFDKCHAWIDLLLMASHEKHTFMKRGQITELDRGQLVSGRKFLAERWHWSEAKVRRFICTLEAQQMCTTNRTQNGTVISLVNYSKFQNVRPSNDTPNETPNDTTDEPTDDTLTRMDKNGKNGERGAQRRRPRLKSKEEDERMCEEIIREYEEKEKNGNA